MNPHPRRTAPELLEAKHVLSRAKALAGISNGEIATALGCHTAVVSHMTSPSQTGDHMRLADLLLLAKHPSMRQLVSEILGQVQERFDHQHLRVCDLDRMSMSTATADSARAALMTVVARLWPDMEMASTANGAKYGEGA